MFFFYLERAAVAEQQPITTLGTLIDLILSIKQHNQPSIFVFLYNVLMGVPVTHTTDPNDPELVTIESLNSRYNAAAILAGGYTCNNALWSLYETFKSVTAIKPSDFGITILMLYFAEYYTREQYPLFVDEFRCIQELAIIEKFLMSYNQSRIRLPLNLSIHAEYGLKKQAHKFVNSNHITVQLFEMLVSLIQQKPLSCSASSAKRMRLSQPSMSDTGANTNLTPKMFIDFVSMFHIRIIESLYMFTSITKNCKAIIECNEFTNVHKLEYTFMKPIRTDDFSSAEYWFKIPIGALWFAYYRGHVKFSSYAPAAMYGLLNVFAVHNVDCVVVGFINVADNVLSPLIFEYVTTNWTETVAAIKYLKLNCVFQPISTLNTMLNSSRGTPNFYFVRNQIPGIFKYCKK